MDITVNRNVHQSVGVTNTSPLSDNLNDDEFAFTRAEKIKLAHLTTGGTGGGAPINVTYDELVVLVNTSGLTAEQKYLMTDFQTTHYIGYGSETTSGEIEPLILTAMSTSNLYAEAYSPLYPQDIIYYSINNDTSDINP